MRGGGARRPGAYPILVDAASGRPRAAGLRPLLPLGFGPSPPSCFLSPGRVTGFVGPAGASATGALMGCGAGQERLSPGPRGLTHRPRQTQRERGAGGCLWALDCPLKVATGWTGRARGGLGAAPAPPWAPRALGGGSVVQGALCGAQVLRVCSPEGPGLLAGGGGLASFMGRTHSQHAQASAGCSSHAASPLGWPAASTAPGLPGPLPCGSAPSVSGGGVYPLGALSLGGLRGARQSISSPRPTRKGFHRQEHGLALPLQKTAPVQAPEPAGGCQPLSAGRGRRGGRCL